MGAAVGGGIVVVNEVASTGAAVGATVGAAVTGAAVVGGAEVDVVDGDVMSGMVPARPASWDVPHADSINPAATTTSHRAWARRSM